MDSLYEEYKEQFKNKEFEYSIVDNHSQDDSSPRLKKNTEKYPGFHFIQNPKNNGFGAGNNLGEKKTAGEYLLFLNNDTQVHGRGILDMLEYIDAHDSVAILGGQLQNIDGTIQSSIGKFYTLFNLTLLLLGFQRFGIIDKNPKEISRVDWVKGALFMIRKNVFEELGGFDEKIFMYTEDMELCYRAKKSGYLTYFFPTEGIFHKEHGSSDRSFAIVSIYQNILYFYKKHMPLWQIHIIAWMLKAKATILLILGKITGSAYLSSTYGKALSILR